jgi:hypothetical protein
MGLNGMTLTTCVVYDKRMLKLENILSKLDEER